MAASPRASARRCWKHAVYDSETASSSPARSWTTACRAPTTCRGSRSATTSTPCTHNPLGVKGCGEAGAIAAPAAVINAVLDALAPLGVTASDMPATPQNVWQAINRTPRGGRIRRRPMYNFTYHRPASLADAVEAALKARADGKHRRRRHDPDPDPEAAAGQPSDLVDLGGIADLKGIKVDGNGRHHRRHDHAMPTVAASAEVAKAHPGAGRARRRHRRPAGAQPRHHRRLGRQQRPGRRLSGGRRRRWAPRSRPTSARSRPTISSTACSRPRWRTARSSPPSASRCRRRPATPSSPTRPRAMPWSA